MELTTSGNNTAGETYILQCTLSDLARNVNVDFRWLRHDSMISDTSARTIKISPYVSQLVFNPLQSSHGGNVKCQAKIEPDITIVKQLNIIVNGIGSVLTSLLSY